MFKRSYISIIFLVTLFCISINVSALNEKNIFNGNLEKELFNISDEVDYQIVTQQIINQILSKSIIDSQNHILYKNVAKDIKDGIFSSKNILQFDRLNNSPSNIKIDKKDENIKIGNLEIYKEEIEFLREIGNTDLTIKNLYNRPLVITEEAFSYAEYSYYYSNGFRTYFKGEYKYSQNYLSSYIKNYPEGEYIEKAHILYIAAGWGYKVSTSTLKTRIENYLKTFPEGNFKYYAYYLDALIGIKEKNYSEASEKFLNIIDNSTNSEIVEDSIYLYGLSEFLLKDYDKALAAFEEYKGIRRDEYINYLNLLYLYENERYEECIYMSEITDVQDEYISKIITLLKGCAQRENGEFEEALASFQKIQSSEDDDFFDDISDYNMAFTYMITNRFEKSKSYIDGINFNSAKDSLYYNSRYIMGLINFFISKNFLSEFRDFLDNTTKSNRLEWTKIRRAILGALTNDNYLDSLIDDLNGVIKKTEDLKIKEIALAWLPYCRIIDEYDLTEESLLEDVNVFRQEFPDSNLRYFVESTLAMFYEKEEDYEKLESVLVEILADNYGNQTEKDVRIWLINLYKDTNQYKKYTREIINLINTGNLNLQSEILYMYELGNVYYEKLNDTQNCILWYEKILSATDNVNIDLHIMRKIADIFYELKEYSKAFEAYEKLKEKSEEGSIHYLHSIYGLSKILINEKKYVQAKPYLKELYDNSSYKADFAFVYYADQLIREGDKEEGINLYKRLEKEFPESGYLNDVRDRIEFIEAGPIVEAEFDISPKGTKYIKIDTTIPGHVSFDKLKIKRRIAGQQETTEFTSNNSYTEDRAVEIGTIYEYSFSLISKFYIESDQSKWFKVRFDVSPLPPTGIKTKIRNGFVTLTWDKSAVLWGSQSTRYEIWKKKGDLDIGWKKIDTVKERYFCDPEQLEYSRKTSYAIKAYYNYYEEYPSDISNVITLTGDTPAVPEINSIRIKDNEATILVSKVDQYDFIPVLGIADTDETEIITGRALWKKSNYDFEYFGDYTDPENTEPNATEESSYDSSTYWTATWTTPYWAENIIINTSFDINKPESFSTNRWELYINESSSYSYKGEQEPGVQIEINPNEKIQNLRFYSSTQYNQDGEESGGKKRASLMRMYLTRPVMNEIQVKGIKDMGTILAITFDWKEEYIGRYITVKYKDSQGISGEWATPVIGGAR